MDNSNAIFTGIAQTELGKAAEVNFQYMQILIVIPSL